MSISVETRFKLRTRLALILLSLAAHLRTAFHHRHPGAARDLSTSAMLAPPPAAASRSSLSALSTRLYLRAVPPCGIRSRIASKGDSTILLVRKCGRVLLRKRIKRHQALPISEQFSACFRIVPFIAGHKLVSSALALARVYLNRPSCLRAA